MGRIRTFVGVKASSRINKNVAKHVSRLARCESDYNWVEEENLHITLNFVGDVVDTEVPELCKLIREPVEAESAFHLSVEGIGAFPDLDRPRVVWAGIREGKACLDRLNKVIEDVLSHWGINKDRNKFVPHVTLGRLKRGGRWNENLLMEIDRLASHEYGTCYIDNVTVFSSYLDRGGPTYTPMATIKLAD